MKLIQFTEPNSVDRPRPIAVNPVNISWLACYRDYDGKRGGTIIGFTSGSTVLVAESYETVLDALQSVEVGRP